MIYKVKIVETLLDVYEIEASSSEEAINKVEDLYLNQKIILNADNFIQYEILIDEEE